ncbi:helix-turn-helix domain-containing protein [Streptomyces sp. NPDC001404]|uniref:helix-turn-helix domain-containing protein n=1 Tax=Streptomyces sp. NPDC001404 TaxID=3364571 RepID=UPI0036BABCC4
MTDTSRRVRQPLWLSGLRPGAGPARRFREGEITIARALRELEQAGYLERKRVRTEGGRVVTVTRWYERPGATSTSRKLATPAKQPPEPLPPADPPAAELLAGLRRRDPRLLLSAKDVRRLSPAVRAWLDRGVGPARIVRTLSADLPVGAITWPARLLAHRLANWLPPALPTPAAEPSKPRPLPLQTCDGCERAFRAERPGLCRDCRTACSDVA